MKKIGKYLKIWILRCKMSLMEASEYRTSVVFYFLASLTWSLTSLFLRGIIYNIVDEIKGWTFDEMALLIAIYNFSFAFLLMLSWNAIYHHFRPAVREGNLDFHLTRPISPRFMLTTGDLDINGILHLIPSSIIFFYTLSLDTISFNLVNIILFIFYFFIGQYIIYSICYLFYSIIFLTTSADHVSSVFWTMQDITKHPLEIFPNKLRFMLLFIIPIGFVAYIPTKALLGQLSYRFFAFTIIFNIFLVIINKLVWEFGVQKYESVSS